MYRPLHILSCGIALLLLGSITAPAARAQLVLDPQFDDQLVLGTLSAPVAMSFVPGSTTNQWRMLFVEQKLRRVRLVVNGALSTTDPVGTIPDVVSSGNEQGLLSLAIDPRWPEKPYVYIHYNSTTGFVRLSRFTLAGDLAFTGNGALTLDPATRYDLITNIPDLSTNHNGGCLRFTADHKLLFSTGEDFQYCVAQDSTSLLGKLLRLEVKDLPDTAGGPPPLSLLTPADNPWAGSANAVRALQYAVGLRNPFRFQVDAQDGMVYLGDVGNVTWEEVDRVPPGSNCGWPVYEGFVQSSSCVTGVPNPHNAPIAVYDHGSLGGRSVMLLAVYRSPGATAPHAFPAEYEGTVFYSDYYTGLFRGVRWNGTTWTPVSTPGLDPNWATGAQNVNDGTIGPDGALWYLRQSVSFGLNTGQIRRIRYTGALDAPGRSDGALSLALASGNPAHAGVALRYVLAEAGDVTLEILDASGRRVRGLVTGATTAGEHTIHWDGRDDGGAQTAAGVYFARLAHPAGVRTLRISRLP